jgi:N-acetylglucosaminyl-diphospho-decaprenol L-rhamnosyltransferase
MSPTIDVVIPTFGGWPTTERCLASLRRQTVPHAVVVADNGSPDGTPERLRETFPEVALVALPENLGFAVACNRGAAAGEGEIVVLLNNDVEARPDFLERLVAPFSDPAVGSSTPLLLGPDGATIDCVGIAVDPTLAGFSRLHGRPAADAGEPRPLLAGPLGAGGAYRRSAWEQAGGLDEGVLFYGEDTDLALRLRAAGWRAAAATDAVAVHLGSATAGRRSSWQRFQSGFGRGYFARRYGLVRTRVAPRLLATELLVAAGDTVLNRDLAAARGRVAGWRAARGLPKRPPPPAEAVDAAITLRESIRLRRVAYRS